MIAARGRGDRLMIGLSLAGGSLPFHMFLYYYMT